MLGQIDQTHVQLIQSVLHVLRVFGIRSAFVDICFCFFNHSVFRIVWHLRNKHEHEASEQLLEEIMTCIREIVSQLLAHYDMYKKHCKLDAGMLNANTFFKLQFTLLFLGNAKAGKAETGSMKPPCANTPIPSKIQNAENSFHNNPQSQAVDSSHFS